MDHLYDVMCLRCNRQFGLKEEFILTATELRCPYCNQKMSLWQLMELKREYYDLMLKLQTVISSQLVQIPDVRMFQWKLAESDGDNTDKYIRSVLKLLSDFSTQEGGQEYETE